MDEGTLIMAGLKKDSVLNAIGIVTAQAHDCSQGLRTVPDYMTDNVSKKVVRIIVSYIDYVNRTVWNKEL
jgi:UDP-N-acetylglucosamine 2-epimerase (non-hydrolysing)